MFVFDDFNLQFLNHNIQKGQNFVVLKKYP